MHFDFDMGFVKLGIPYTDDVHQAIKTARLAGDGIEKEKMTEELWGRVLLPQKILPTGVVKPSWSQLVAAGTIMYVREAFEELGKTAEYERLVASKDPVNATDLAALSFPEKPPLTELKQAATNKDTRLIRNVKQTALYEEKKRRVTSLFGFEKAKRPYEDYLLHKVLCLQGDTDAVALDALHTSQRVKILAKYTQLQTDIASKTLAELEKFYPKDQENWEDSKPKK